MAKGAKKPETIVVSTERDWESLAARDLVLDSILASGNLKEFVRQQMEAYPGTSNLSGMTAIIRNVLQQNIGFDKPLLSTDLADELASLARFEEQAVVSRSTYNLEAKPNPDAVLWPDPTGEMGKGNLYETLPFVEPLELVDRETPIGSAGSCFAVEIARNLVGRGFNYVITEPCFGEKTGVFMAGVDPQSTEVEFSANWGILFNSPSFRQIAEKAFEVRELPRLLVRLSENPPVYSDPFREAVMFPSVESYEADYENHRRASREALETCEIFIITLGLNECWQFIPDGSVLSRNPRNADLNGLLRLRTLTVEENVADIQAFIDIVRARNPRLKLLISVSPVPFLGTGRGDEYHVVAANGHSKAVLRVAAQELAERNRDVFYFPSYEVVTMCTREPWAADQRHVSREGVARVMDLFDAMFLV